MTSSISTQRHKCLETGLELLVEVCFTRTLTGLTLATSDYTMHTEMCQRQAHAMENGACLAKHTARADLPSQQVMYVATLVQQCDFKGSTTSLGLKLGNGTILLGVRIAVLKR